MFKKIFSIGNQEFIFLFTHEPYYVDIDTIVMGFPYNIDPASINESNVNEIKGYYTCFKIASDKLQIINDIMGNYRTYYMKKDGVVYFSNDFLTLFSMLSKEDREPNKFEIEYWDKHRYTTGGETFCTKIHKIKPAHIYNFRDNKIEEKMYFKDIKNTPNREKHFDEILSDLRETVSVIKKMPQKKFLLFSGGADSTLCVKLLQEQNVDFIPVFAKHTPTNSMNYDDNLKVMFSATLLGINPLEVEVDTRKGIDNKIIDIMFTDRSITQLFFEVAKKIREKFGQNAILINGQAADSVLGFGPTSNGIRHNMVRSLLYNPFTPLNYIYYEIFKLARPIFKNYRRPLSETEYFNALFDEKFYIPLIEKAKSSLYYDKIESIIVNIKYSLREIFSCLMYLKIYGFMQGSDNYVNVQNCEYHGIKSIFMYGTQNIIYSTIQNTDYHYEICHPKSVVYKILKDVFNYTMPDIRKKKNYKKEIKSEKTYGQYESEMYQNFYNKLRELEFSKEVSI